LWLGEPAHVAGQLKQRGRFMREIVAAGF
jgi:hypothetical protein